MNGVVNPHAMPIIKKPMTYRIMEGSGEAVGPSILREAMFLLVDMGGEGLRG
jgi:hypothetical protein